MFLGFITVVLVDAILFLLIRLVHTQWMQKNQSVPLTYAAGLFALCCLAHFGATKTIGRAVVNTGQAWQAVVASAVCGFAPIWAYVHMLFSRFGEETEKRRAVVYPRAHRLRAQGDIEGALREYLKYYEAVPSKPRPLFSAANMLELEKEYQKAATLFRRIMELFEDDDDAWTKAAYRLTFLREHHLDDKEGAASMRTQIEQRIPPEIRARHESRDLESSGI